MNVTLEVPEEKFPGDKPVPHIVMMPPGELAFSPFGNDVNPPATPEEELALRESIAKNGVQVPLTAGRVAGKGKYAVVKGTRRHAVALALRLEEIPVELKEYESLEDMRQDALRDNLERRQLTTAGRAELANTLWRSFDCAEDKKEMASRGFSPRKRAAIAGGLSEGALASYRYVLDSGNAELIGKVKSGELSIGKAASEAKRLTEANTVNAKAARNPTSSEHVKDLRDALESLSRASAILRETVKSSKAALKLAKKGLLDHPAILIKQMRTVSQAIDALASDSDLTGPTPDQNTPLPD